MDSPVFKLEGVVKSKDEKLDFVGPLTLILNLLSKDKIEIRDISISLILEQYVSYLDKLTEANLGIASEFAAMASHLTYIKTKMLLSDGKEVSELEALMTSLEELKRGDCYKAIKSVTEPLLDMYSLGAALLTKPPEYLPPDNDFGYILEKLMLKSVIIEMLGKEELTKQDRNIRKHTIPLKIAYSVSEKISEILTKLRTGNPLNVYALFYSGKSRSEVIATFIAVLELCKAGGITLEGDGDDLTISYNGAELDYSEE